MNICIVTYDMIPYAFTWGGCQRMYYLAKRLKEKGENVHIIAIRSAAYNTFGKEVFRDVIFTEPTPKDNPSTIKASKESIAKGMKKLLKDVAFQADKLFFNEIQAGNGIKAYHRFRKAKETIKDILQKNKYDVAIVSGPPFVVFDAIQIIRKKSPKTKIIMDYRDPWNFWHTGNPITTQREKHIQELADAIVCTNEHLCHDMAETFGIDSTKYHVMANGYADDVSITSIYTGSSPNQKSRFDVVYTGAIAFNGTIDSYRDTTKLIQALRELRDEGLSNICLTFVGAANPDTEEAICLKKELGESIRIIGHVPSDEAKQYVADADACLLLHTTNDASGKYLVSGKLYDYIQQKKYVISIASDESQHAEILNKYSIGLNSANKKDCIKLMLKTAYDQWIDGQFNSVYDNIDISEFSRASQVEKYVNLITNL